MNKNLQNLYEVRKSIRFELKPSETTLKSLNEEKIFESPHFKSKVFVKNSIDQLEAEKKEKNYQFCINFEELKNLVQKCDERFEKVKDIKNYLEENPKILWSIWIVPEKIKIIDKDLKYKLQEKKSWKKEFWNEISKTQVKGKNGKGIDIKFKKGDLFTLDDIDAFFEKVRSTEKLERKAGKFTLQVLEKISYLLHQYEIRKRQILLDNNLPDISFLKKKELVARMRNFLGMFLNIERTLSLFVPEYSTEKAKFDPDLKVIFDEYKENLQNTIQEIETIFKESDLYLHNNIQRRFSLNIRAINPNPESTDKTENQKITEEKILEKIEKLENEILKLKNEKATIKGERKEKKNSGDRNWENHRKSEWNNAINQLNPSNKEGKFSQLSELRRDLEEVKITHYAVLIEKEGNFFLAMENKRKTDNSIKKINEFSLLNLPLGNTCKALVYNSLTFKALRRLCLEESSLMKTDNFLNLQNTSWKEEVGNGRRTREVNRDWKSPEYLRDLISYLQERTTTKFKEIGVSFNPEQYEKWGNCENLEELEILINKQGYQAKWQNISWEDLLQKENIEIFQIFNKDFTLDENFATSEKDKEKIKRLNKAKESLGDKFIPKQQKQDRKKDLFTVYWNNFFQDCNSEEWRIRPEGKFYVRLKDDTNETQRLVGSDEKTNKARYFENKIFADFGLGINSNIDEVGAKAKAKEEVEKHIKNMNELHKKDPQNFYILGLDRGLNSLVSYCLLDSNLQIIKADSEKSLYEKDDKNYNEQTNFVCGDWSLVNSKGEFVKRGEIIDHEFYDKAINISFFQLKIDNKNLYEIEGETLEAKNKRLEKIIEYYNQFDYNKEKGEFRLKILEYTGKYEGNEGNLGSYFCLVIFENHPLKKYEFRDKNGQEIIIRDTKGFKVYDYVLSFYVEKAKRVFTLYKQQTLDSSIKYSEEELEELLFESQDDLKEGFTNFVVGEIVALAQKIADIKNKKLYIALEDLSNYGNMKKPTTQNEDEKSFKKENHDKNLSVIVYQKLENNLVKKFNYIETKNDASVVNKAQFSPKIKRITDINNFQGKNQLGNLLFIDPENTSKQCPNCNEVAERNHSRPTKDFVKCKKGCYFDTREDGDKKEFDFIDGGDTLAAYNIAKKWLEYLSSKKEL